MQKVVGLIFETPNQYLWHPQLFKPVHQAHQPPAYSAQDLGAFFSQVLHKILLDLEVSAVEIIATGTFILDFQVTKALVLALTHACVSDPEDAFTARAFKLQLYYFLTQLLIQGL